MNTTDTTNHSLIRLPEVLKRTGFGKAWIYRLISEGRFPDLHWCRKPTL